MIPHLSSPDSWHLESISEEVDRIGDYALTSLGRQTTELKIATKDSYKTIEVESTLKLKQNLSEEWEKHRAGLAKDYASNYHSK